MWWFTSNEVVLSKLLELRALVVQQAADQATQLADIRRELAATRRQMGDIYRVFVFPRVKIVGEADMANVMIFDVDLPPVKDPDTVSRTLKVTIGEDVQTIPVTKDQTTVAGLKGPQDATVILELSDTDDAGNTAPYPKVEVQLKDTIPPAIDGSPSVRVTGEE